MLVAIALGGVFYVACILAQSWGFGTDEAGVAAFAGSSAPLGELAREYAGAPMAAVLDLVAVISAIGAGLGCVVVAVRLLYALGRDRMLAPALAALSPTARTPTTALWVEMAFGLVALIAFRLAGTAPIGVFFLLATFGMLNLVALAIVTRSCALDLGSPLFTEGARPLVLTVATALRRGARGRRHPHRRGAERRPAFCGAPTCWAKPTTATFRPAIFSLVFWYEVAVLRRAGHGPRRRIERFCPHWSSCCHDSYAATGVGKVRSQVGITTRNRDHASHKQNNNVARGGPPAHETAGPTPQSNWHHIPGSVIQDGRCAGARPPPRLGLGDRTPGGPLIAVEPDRDQPCTTSART